MRDKANVLWTEFLVYSFENPICEHQHDFFHCIYAVEGSGEIEIDKKKLRIIPGFFYIVRPNTSHSFRADENATLMLMEIKFRLFDENLLEKLMSFPVSVSVLNSPVYSVMKKIRTELTEKKALFSEITTLNLIEIFAYIERNVIDESKDIETKEEIGNDFFKIISYIHDNLHRRITLQELADKMCLEKSYFLKLFRNKYGCTPVKYANIVRFEKAKELLIHSDKNITQISDALGFKSVHHFSAMFKKVVGISPTIYMKNK